MKAFMVLVVAAVVPAVARGQVADGPSVARALAAIAAQPTATPAQVDLTLDEAVARALERNLDIAVQRVNPQISDLDIAEAYAAYRPTVTSTLGNASRTQASSTQLDGGQRVVVNNQTFNAGLSQELRWGGASLDLNWSNSRNETSSTFASLNPSYRSNLEAVFTQPLLRGLRIDAGRQRLQVTQINRELSEVDLRRTIVNTEASVRSSYWDYVYTIEALAVRRQSLALAESLIEDNRARVELGTLAPIDIVQSQSEAAQRRQAVAEAEQVLRTAELALKRLLVGGTSDGLWLARINPVDRPVFDPPPIDLDAAIRTALSQRLDLTRARRQLDINDINVRTLRDATLPSIDLRASYVFQGLGGTEILRSGLGGDVSGVISGGFGDAFSQLITNEFPSWNVSVTMSYPLGQSAEQASHARAELQIRQTEAQIQQLELQIATEVTNAATQIQSILERIEAARAASQLTQEQVDAELSKFQVGMSTNFLVVQAQRDLAEARESELRALLDYQKALIEFERVQQSSLAGGGITIAGGGGGN